MDKVVAILLSMLLVILVIGEVFFEGVMPGFDDKTDEMIVELDGFNFSDAD